MGIVTSAAREAGVVLPVGAVMAQLMASARANGDGGLDHSALLRGVERLSGIPSDNTDNTDQKGE
jgi:2-hydroxy-3-oxopropionate reductase